MDSRRKFFKDFIGQMGLLFDEMHGVKNIPLNRLNELPANIIEQIEPIFFPEENWCLEDKSIINLKSKSTEKTKIELNDIEFKAYNYFLKNTRLKQTAKEIKKTSEIPFENIYSQVANLFFKLASHRICHPREVYQIDEIIHRNKEYQR